MAVERQPKQDRGRERRDKILDAAARLLVKEGERAVTMQAVAAQAGASNGSMYHFFGDQRVLLDALFQRYADALGRHLSARSLENVEYWLGLSAAGLIDELFGRALLYFSANPAALYLLARRKERRFPAFEAKVEAVMMMRLGEQEGPAVARTLFAVSTGTLLYLQEAEDFNRGALIANIPAVLTAYLTDQEEARKRSWGLSQSAT